MARTKDTMAPIRRALLKVPNLAEVARVTRISYRQLINLRDGVTKYPRADRMDRLTDYFRTNNEEGA